MNTILTLTALLFFPGGLFVLLMGLAYEWVDRKLVAQFQNRVGPRWFQPLADTIKLLAKEEVVPDGVNAGLFVGLPIVALASVLTATLYVPMVGLAPSHSFPGDLIVAVYLLSLPTLCIGLAGVIFGWARPVPVNPSNFRSYRWGEVTTSFAGPASNLLLAALFAFLLRLNLGGPGLVLLAYYGCTINIFLALFNLLPIPPLDGSHLVAAFLPYRLLQLYRYLEPVGFIIILLLFRKTRSE